MKKLRFLVSLHTRENDFQVAQGQSAEIAARKLGVDAEIVFADNDAVNQSAQLLKAIQGRVESRPDAIVVEATRQKVKEQIERWCELFPDKLPGESGTVIIDLSPISK